MSRDFQLIAKMMSVALNDSANPEEARNAAMKAIELLAKQGMGPDHWHEYRGQQTGRAQTVEDLISNLQRNADEADWRRWAEDQKLRREAAAAERRSKRAASNRSRTDKVRRGPTEQQSKAARVWAQRVEKQRARQADQNWDDFMSQF